MTVDAFVGVNVGLCSGCYACAVACMDQNDLETGPGREGWRLVKKVERGAFPDAEITYYSVSCLNCAEPRCLKVCPAGALSRPEQNGTVLVNASLCIGCRACARVCPHGMPRFGSDGKMAKCDGCRERTAAGLSPACVRICPTGALDAA